MDPLATAGELENHLQREIDPDIAGQALQLASGAVRAFCKWDLGLQVGATLQAEGSGTVVLTLPTLQLLAVDEVRVDGVVIDIAAPYMSWSRKGQLYRGYGWPRFTNIEVDCDHGYAEAPDLVKLVVLDLAARQLSNPQGLVSAQVGQVSQTWSSGGSDTKMSALHERLLERYSI